MNKFFGLILLGLFSFGLSAQNPTSLNIFQLGDPAKINPVLTISTSGRIYLNCIFSRLLEFDPQTLELIPQLAANLPEIQLIKTGKYAGGMSISFEIKAEAKWDDGKPVLASDYIFTVKTLKFKLINADHLRPFYSFIDDITADPKNSKKFTIYSKKLIAVAAEAAGDLHILPEHIYDPQSIMKSISFDLLNSEDPSLEKNQKYISFADSFNSIKFFRETVIGSGPYRLIEWESGNFLLLTRKSGWWGDKGKNYADSSFYYPDTLQFKIINDYTTAIELAKKGELDILDISSTKLFLSTKNDNSFSSFNFYNPENFSLVYIGINSLNPKLNDKRTRNALACLIDKKEISSYLYGGMTISVNSSISPSKSTYNKELKDIAYDFNKAKNLLLSAGWKDSNKNGILDKQIEGKTVELILKFKYNEGNETRKNIGLLYQESAAMAGVKIELEALEWNAYLQDLRDKNFDIFCGGLINYFPGLDEMRSLWHSSSASNRTGFGNAETDSLIEAIEMETDKQKRIGYYKKLQEIIYDEQCFIFLFSPKSSLMLNKKIAASNLTSIYPGYQAERIKLLKSK